MDAKPGVLRIFFRSFSKRALLHPLRTSIRTIMVVYHHCNVQFDSDVPLSPSPPPLVCFVSKYLRGQWSNE